MSHPDYKHIGSPFTRLVEECSELIQAAAKCDRFGPDNHHPERGTTNSDELLDEWDDVEEAFLNYLESL